MGTTWHLLALQTGLGDSLASQPGLALALLFGAGVGTGVSMGAKEAREGDSWDDD